MTDERLEQLAFNTLFDYEQAPEFALADVVELVAEVRRLRAEARTALPWLIQRVRELEAERQWIPVTDQMPPTDGLYLVYGDCTGEGVGVDIAGFHAEVPIFAKYRQPTHWRPLPAPPAS